MSKFTEAPWVADKHCDGVYSEIADRYVASTAFGYDDVDEDERKGNARLIASAPELYELAQNTADYILEANKLYAQFPQELVTYAERIKELLERIYGEEEQ